ncbi:MAG: discoidin domain-containing protein, partial [Anaerohalosphaera sp.]|nr:discoidin domain-containing protein [Anaerohalosphaera sp.]
NEIAGPENPTVRIDHLAVGCPVDLKYSCSAGYTGGSESPLTDGVVNNVSPRWSFYYDKWLGFEVNDLHATIDLQKEVEVSRVTTRFLEKLESWIFAPKQVKIQVSLDGKEFADLKARHRKERAEGGIGYVHFYESSIDRKAVRYVRVHAKNVAVCPEWHPGSGGNAWLFTDEIIVK